MSEENKTNSLDLAIALVEKAEIVYDDSLKPVAKRVGKIGDTIGGTVEMLLSPITGMVFCYDKIKTWLPQKIEEKLSKVPLGQRISPPGYIAIPALQRLVYTDSEDLQEMFANLIANSMDSKTTSQAHPAFVEIISQLTPDEARILKYIGLININGNIPKVDAFELVDKNVGSYKILYSNIFDMNEVENKNLVQEYLDNLERLFIIRFKSQEFSDTSAPDVNEKYTLLETVVKGWIKESKNTEEIIEIRRGLLQVTDFGMLIINATSGKI